MSIVNFDPKRYVVLDWFGLTKRAYPDLDWSDKDTVLEKTEALLAVLDFEVSPGYLNVSPKLDKANAQKLGVYKPSKLAEYVDKLDWLLPSGIFIKSPVFGNGVSGTRHALIEYEDKKFIEYFDGSFVCITPEIDERLVKIHWGESATVNPAPVVEIEYFDESLRDA